MFSDYFEDHGAGRATVMVEKPKDCEEECLVIAADAKIKRPIRRLSGMTLKAFRGMNMKIIKHVEHGYILINYLVYHYVSIMFVEVPP